MERKKQKKSYSSDTMVRSPNKFLFKLFSFAFDTYLFFNFKLKIKKEVKKIEKPSIILVTHGSFIDFMFSLRAVGKYYPHVVAARMYLYHKFMGSMLKKGGVIPKSMFTADLESAKNCFRVLTKNEVLLMMPEARLSTVGRFEGIQAVTEKFLFRAGVDIYTLKICGNYLAMPKWGRRRLGAPVECTLDRFMRKEDIAQTDFETFKERLESAMDYDDFEWLKENPKVKYRDKKLAEGLEGVLYKCPVCRREGTNVTLGRKIICSSCGHTDELDERYAFKGGIFNDIRDWYDYQYNGLVKEIESDPDYCLCSKVVLKHSSKDGKTCLRKAGEGVCKLSRSGLTYEGTDDGNEVKVGFNGNEVYRLLFGVNEDFEIYRNKEIYYFVPENKRLCAKWYLASMALKDYFKE